MKKIWTLILAATTALSAAAAPSNGARLTLDKNWTLAREGAAETYAAQVPSTVAGTLYDAGVFGEGLFEGLKYKQVDKTPFDDVWTYTTTFAGKPRKGQHTELVFDGLNFYADVFLNGQQIASSDTTFGVFIRRAYDVTKLLKKRNTLEVKLRRAQKGDLNIGFVDWNPRPLDESMGIVRPVTLHTTGAVSIEDVYVIPSLELSSLKQANLKVCVTLRNRESKPVDAILALNLEGVGKARVAVALKAGETRRIELTPAEAAILHLDNPRVWWSWDLGTPEMYRLSVCAEAAGRLSDTRTTDFGVRSIESRLTDKGYRQMTLNGRDVLIKGAGWTDDLFLRDTPEGIERQVRYVKDMNLNLIRFENIWGKDDTVYDLCDREGVLALVGFSCQWEWEDYCGLPEVKGYGCIFGERPEALAVQYFRDQVVRLHNHPSVIAWMTGSDRIPHPGLEKRYLEIYAQEDYRPYICSAKDQKSLAGRSGTKMEGPYEYVAPDYWYRDTKAGGAFGWNTETGIGANIAQLESIRRMVGDEKALWPLSEAWDYHCTAAASAMHSTDVLQETIKGQYGGWTGLEDFVRKAHAVDYDGTRAMFEAFRVRVPNATGIVQWMLNSAWPSLYWQLYDWYGVPTASYYGTKKGCEPRQLLFDFADRKVYAVNESFVNEPLTATLKIFDADSKLLAEESKTVSAGYRETVPVFDLKPYDGKPHFVALELTGANGKSVADNFYCIPARENEYKWKKTNWYITPITRYADLGFVFASTPDVEMTVAPAADGYTVTLRNRSERIAPMNILKAKDAAGALIVPAWWSDNFFALLPGQTKTVTCRTEGVPANIELN